VTVDVDFGLGIYSLPEALSILRHRGRGVSARSLNLWVNSGLTPGVPGNDHDPALLTFHDLVSVEVIRRFREEGTSLQAVRKIQADLREIVPPHITRPFATRVFFYTDGRSVWAQFGDVAREVVGRRAGHLVIPDAIRTFAREIRFVDDVATGWELSPDVEIDPRVQFGAPVVRGTRIPVSTIAAQLRAGTPEQVADWYALTVRQVEGVAQYLRAA
jgi:uncharacterized protein (DUF433 family)